MKVRRANINDIIAIYEIAKHTWHDTYKNIFTTDFINQFIEKSYSDENLKQSIEDTEFYVVEEESVIIGFLQFVKKESKTYELSRLYLLPAYQGRGIGSLLLNDAIEDVNPKVITLDVEEENTHAIRFYSAKGFHVTDKYTEDFLGQTLQTVKMTKLISDNS